jgi:GTP cyclohydrolase II
LRISTRGQSQELDAVAQDAPRLVLPAARLRRLGSERQQPGTIALPVVDFPRIEALALRTEGRIDAPVSPTAGLDDDALELARLALILPPCS